MFIKTSTSFEKKLKWHHRTIRLKRPPINSHPIHNHQARRLNSCCLTTIAVADCAVCAEGYAPGFAYSCRQCSKGTTRSAVALSVAVGLAVTLFAALLVSFLGSVVRDGAEEDMGIDQSFWKKKCGSCRPSVVNVLPVRAIKIVATVWQIISQVCYCRLPPDSYIRSV